MEIIAASWLLPVAAPPLAGGAIAVADGRIVAVGPLNQLRAAFAAPVQEYPGCVLLPGLVNAHTHLSLTHFPAWKLRKGLDYLPRTYVDWIEQVVKLRRALTPHERSESLREGIAKALEAGTTTVGEIVSERELLPLYGATPLGGRLFLEAIGHEPTQSAVLADELEQVAVSLPTSGRLQPGYSPHTPHTVGLPLLERLAATASRHQWPLMIHLAEASEELAFWHDSSGPLAERLYPAAGWQAYLPSPQRSTPVAWLAAAGLLSPGTVAVHCVHVTPADVALLKQHGVSVVICPRSNERLNVGLPPVALLKGAGLLLALGTDSLASNDSLSLWDELRFLLARFPGVFTADEALALVTTDAARVLQLEGEVGALVPGSRADYLLVQPGHLPGTPTDVADTVIHDSRLLQVVAHGVPV